MKTTLGRTQCTLVYVVCWLPLFLLYAVMLRQTGIAPKAAIALLWSASYIAPGIAMGACAWSIARRLSWQSFGWLRFIGTELLIISGFILSWHLLFLAWLWAGAGREAALTHARGSLGWELLLALFIVTIHSAVFHVVRVLGELRQKELATAQAEALRMRAEMQALRGQLNPHFLFNSLHSIIALVREDAGRAEEALLQFSTLLRRVLDVKSDVADEVTLADEMRFVDDYLAIERLRLGDRLRVTRELTHEALECWLPAFSVQPLVENAIHHAIAPRRDGGLVEIRAAVRDSRLEISVSDDGPGADPERVNRATGVGLGVIRQRIALRHGKQAELTIHTTPGHGFRATILMPAEKAEMADGREGSLA